MSTSDRGPGDGDPIRLLICDDHALVVAGVRALLADSPEIRLVGEARNAHEVTVLARSRRPDVVLLGVPLSGADLLSTVGALWAVDGDGPTVMVMATNTDEDDLIEAVRAGVRGVVGRTCSGDELARDVRAVASGRAVLSPSLAARLVKGTRPADRFATLTPRETEVLTLVAQGLSDSTIAGALWVSKVTVRSHIHRTMAKLGLSSRAQAVAYYYQHGVFRRVSYAPRGDELCGTRTRPAAG
ncbi:MULTISPECIES: LuxR C-terminal-related transcriptional regulator [unclassified Micromonospora]|uniref:LuxR C-terminal-related transcriptional regulator n=1 Tax=unclassified Micromonospora TaxID=2617518 RepID=UPI00363CA001